MYVEKLIIDIKRMMKSGLSIEQYFIITCIIDNHKKLLEMYVDRIGKIDKSVFQLLINNGWLKLIGKEFTFANLTITDQTKEFFECSNKLDHKRFFQELKEVYPRRVRVGPKRYRTLHSNLEDCERKYKAIVSSEELHKKILKCVKAYVHESEMAGKMEYLQLLPTWINQKNYQTYMEDIDDCDVEEKVDEHDII